MIYIYFALLILFLILNIKNFVHKFLNHPSVFRNRGRWMHGCGVRLRGADWQAENMAVPSTICEESLLRIPESDLCWLIIIFKKKKEKRSAWWRRAQMPTTNIIIKRYHDAFGKAPQWRNKEFSVLLAILHPRGGRPRAILCATNATIFNHSSKERERKLHIYLYLRKKIVPRAGVAHTHTIECSESKRAERIFVNWYSISTVFVLLCDEERSREKTRYGTGASCACFTRVSAHMRG